MKITILGSGVCTSQLPGVENRYPPGFVVETQGKTVMFECSEMVRERLEKAGFDFTKLNHIAISHSHPDHFSFFHFVQAVFVKGLWAGDEYKNWNLNLYCTQHIADNFDLLWDFYFPEMKGERWDWPNIFVQPMSENSEDGGAAQEILPGIKLSARNVYHGFGKVDVLSFRMETEEGILVYSGDTGLCKGIEENIQGADFFVSEIGARVGDKESSANYGHLTPFEAGELAKKGGVKKLILLHYSGYDSDEMIIEDCLKSGYKGELFIAKDGQVLEF